MMNEKTFNKWFNVFILAGMTIAVCCASALKFSDPEASRFMLLLSAFGALMGVASTVLSANGIIWTFVFGLIDVCIYSFNLFQQTPVPVGTLLLHVLYFIPMEFIGFFQWKNKHGASGSKPVEARRLSSKGWLYTIILTVVVYALSFLLSFFVSAYSAGVYDPSSVNTAKVLLDAAMTTSNIVALVLMTMAYMEQWYLWTLVNVSSVIFWAVTLAGDPANGASVVYLVKYVFYFINGMNGIRIWLSLSRRNG